MKNITTIALIIFLSGCASMQSIDPYTGEKKVNNTTKGAAIGTAGLAGVGALIGVLVCGEKCGALGAAAGAGAGFIAGAGTGYYMDTQEDILRKRLVGTGVRIQRKDDALILTMPGSITFNIDSADIKTSFYRTLDSVVIVLTEYDETNIVVSGYTDSTGGDAHNKVLSHARANNVSFYLSENGLERGRLYTQGQGEKFPIASNKTRRGRSLNRRVEITIVPSEVR